MHNSLFHSYKTAINFHAGIYLKHQTFINIYMYYRYYCIPLFSWSGVFSVLNIKSRPSPFTESATDIDTAIL